MHITGTSAGCMYAAYVSGRHSAVVRVLQTLSDTTPLFLASTAGASPGYWNVGVCSMFSCVCRMFRCG